MKTVKYVRDGMYHVYNRGVDGRDVFNEDKDYLRFIFSLHEFNDKRFAMHHRLFKEEVAITTMPQRPLVNILCFCLMPNHFHLVLQQIADGGVTKFMQKLGTGYTMYYNLKHKRQGVLFQGKFKAVAIETDEYLLHLSRYIHLNPIGLIEANWKQGGIKNRNTAKYFLREYRWSSFLDYMNVKNYPFLTKRDIIQRYFKNYECYKEYVEEYLMGDMSRIKDIILG